MQIILTNARQHKQNIRLYFDIDLIVRIIFKTVLFNYIRENRQSALVGQVLYGLLVSIRANYTPNDSKAVL